jgi:hypothetical protein
MNVYLGSETEAIWLKIFQTGQQFWNEVVPQIILRHTTSILKLLTVTYCFCVAITVPERSDNWLAIFSPDAQEF